MTDAENTPLVENPEPVVSEGPVDAEPNLRIETIIKRMASRHRWVLLGSAAGLLLLIGGICWVRGGTEEPLPPPEPTVDVQASIDATLTAQQSVVAPPEPTLPAFDEKDLAELVETRAGELTATRIAEAALRPTSPPPSLIADKANAFTQYRYYHFLEEYRHCFVDRLPGAAFAQDLQSIAPTETPEPTPTPEPEPTPGGDGDGADGPGSEPQEPTIEPTPTPTPVPLRTEYELEIETLGALSNAVSALLTMYDRGECVEPDDYAIYKGRGTWLRLWQ